MITQSGTLRLTAVLALVFAQGTIALCGPIHVATVKGDEAKVVALLKQNPDLVDSRDKFGNTALHLAALHNKVAIAALLLANGADVNARSISAEETPLSLAMGSYQHKEMLELLLTHGADVNVLMPSGSTPLHRAVELERPDDVELLLANGADPNAKGYYGESPVHVAVSHDQIKILKLLLDYGADPNAKNTAGKTPLYYATLYSRPKATELLRAYGAHE